MKLANSGVILGIANCAAGDGAGLGGLTTGGFTVGAGGAGVGAGGAGVGAGGAGVGAGGGAALTI